MNQLIQPIDLRGLLCPNRVFMAPLTRQRAKDPDCIPGELQAVHYSQRASFGLLISEATQISPEGKGYPNTPGIYSTVQVAGWKVVTDRVHAAGGRMFLQLWHVGRISHTAHQPNGQSPVSCVALASPAKMVIVRADGTLEEVPASMPRALETDEMLRVVQDYELAATNAKSAGFDGVEVHGANAYLINQFLSGSLNTRTDAWGGSIENRLRLLMSAVDAAGAVFGYAKVGVRLSPMGNAAELPAAPDDRELMLRAARELGDRKCAYLHLFSHYFGAHGWNGLFDRALAEGMKKNFNGPVVLNGYSRDVASAERDLREGLGDAVAFGKLAISNPDLPERIRDGSPLAEWDASQFYGVGGKGYNDYPTLATK